MSPMNRIPPPLLFNTLKHHLGFIKKFINDNIDYGKMADNFSIIKELQHLGGSVMDVYSGTLTPHEICGETLFFLKTMMLSKKTLFAKWAGKGPKEHKTISLSDGSQWVLKYYNHEQRYVHSFPARLSPHTFRIKANTLKSAILYQIFIGKDYISEEDLNSARAVAGLSPVKDVFDTEAITEMIEILRGY
jgi:hypothetical protein